MTSARAALFRRNVLEEAAAEIGASRPGSAHVQAVDVRKADAVDEAVAMIWDEHGPLTGLINNAARTSSPRPRPSARARSTRSPRPS
jgi:NAD(P)-dependent dehydrogenase (short-subunit alcohol dehydrogenase family)